MQTTKPLLALTSGDFNGIGPEIVLRSIITPSIQRICRPLLLGSIDVFEWYARKCRINILLSEINDLSVPIANGTVPVLHLDKFHQPNITPGSLSKQAGMNSGKAVQEAATLCLEGKIDGMVTAPSSKEAMRLAGYSTPGQTEMLASLCGVKHFTMMLMSGRFRIGLASIHTPLRNVSHILTKKGIFKILSIIHNSLEKDFDIRKPTIAVLGLNPHAGENGLIGNEEKTIIAPAIQSALKNNMRVQGPFPADGFFGTHRYTSFDAVVAMYHDQGLIPLKMKGFDTGVNFTAGLPIVRTSPDHGTAFDIAGKNVASPKSMMEAIKLAVTIINNRRKR